MSILVSEQTLLRRWRTLNPDQQKTALDFVEFLGQKPNKPKQQRRDLLGICATPGLRISAEEIDEARTEMWDNFPRDLEP